MREALTLSRRALPGGACGYEEDVESISARLNSVGSRKVFIKRQTAEERQELGLKHADFTSQCSAEQKGAKSRIAPSRTNFGSRVKPDCLECL